MSLPSFQIANYAEYAKNLNKILKKNLKKVQQLVSFPGPKTWDNLMLPLEDMEDELEKYWSVMSHLHAVVDSKELRQCYEACLPKLSAYESALGQDQALYEAIQSIDVRSLNSVQIKIIEDALKHFKLAGVALPDVQKKRLKAIQKRLSRLSHRFETNILDATQAFYLNIKAADRLKGLPEHALHQAQMTAKERNETGYTLTLDFPCYLAVVSYAEDRDIRAQIYRAYVTRASEVGVGGKDFDNTPVMDAILKLRHEQASLLGFANYSELSLATKMAEHPAEVMDFLTDLAKKSKYQAELEFASLCHFAKEEYGIEAMEPWDLAFIAEKKKHQLYAITQEQLRPYFTLSKVLQGLFTIIQRLYGIQLEEIHIKDTWHKDVVCLALKDSQQHGRGYIYMDLFARKHKRQGAWMDSFQSRRRLLNQTIQNPIASLTCNFAKPKEGEEATLTHDEVLTLFHEMGHCLHHVLTKVDYLSASGIHGVEWDAVELPSQFFENWCWEDEVIQLITKHVSTGETLPKSLFHQLIAAKNFNSALAMLRQLEFSLFDFRIHTEYNPQAKKLVAKILQDVRKEVSVTPISPFNRFQHSFSHVFAGGYSAGYYSYKWAEVLSSDAFSRFEQEGIFNQKTGLDFLHSILEVGSSVKAMDAFVEFRGRAPEIEPLLRHNGITG